MSPTSFFCLLQFQPFKPNPHGGDNGETPLQPLHYAASNGHIEPARLLLEAGADKDTLDGRLTALHHAVCPGPG